MNSGRKVAITAAVLLASGGLTPLATANADQPADLYVSSAQCRTGYTGDGTQARPFCTIQEAAGVAIPGQSVLIEPGSYFGPLTLTHSGDPGAPITFRPMVLPSGGSLNRSSVQISDNLSATQSVLTLASVHDVRISGIEFDSSTLNSGIDVAGSHDVTFDGDHLQGGGASTHSLAIDGSSSSVTVSRTTFTTGADVMISVATGAQQVTVTSNVVAPRSGQGISAAGVSGLSVTGNTILGAPCAPAISIAGASTGVTVENNVARGYAASPATCAAAPLLSVSADSTSGVNVGYNAWAAVPSRFDYTWGASNYTTPAALAAGVPGQGGHDIDIPVADVTVAQPAEGSPLIDSADATAPGATSSDFFGNPRADDPTVANTGAGSGIVDRGAFEREDALTLAPTYSPAAALGAAPYSFTVTPSAGDGWGDALTTTVDFGDGSGVQPVSGGQITHVYATSGTYTATVTTADANGYATQRTQSVQVATAAAPTVTLTATSTASTGSLTWVWPDTGDFTLNAGADRWEIKSMQLYPGDGSAPVTMNQDGIGYGYSHPGTYAAKVVTTDLLGRTSTASATITVGDVFVPQAPSRVFDSRSSHVDSIPAHGTVTLFGGNPAGRTGVAVTATVTDAKASGFLTVYPDHTARPNSSTLNFVQGQTVANTLMAPVGSAGQVEFYNGSSGPIDLIVDTFGYQMGSASHSSGSTYAAVGPVRVLDTRYGTGAAKSPVHGGGAVTVDLSTSGQNRLPADATAVVLNVATTNTKSAGHLTAYDDAAGEPGTSNSNWATGQTVSNQIVVPVSDGKVVLANGGLGSVDFVADLVGYYQSDGIGSVIMPTAPTRILDTRDGTGLAGHVAKLGARQSITLHVAGLHGQPLSADAAELNLTVTNTAGGGFITAYPHGTSLPNASSLNFAPGQTVANAATIPLGSDGSIVLYNGSSAPVDLIVDMNGSFVLAS